MTQAPRYFALIPAAGVGARMGASSPKQYLKIGGRVVYRLQDVESYEAQRLHANTVSPLPAQEAHDAR